jgi:hypothetical protein
MTLIKSGTTKRAVASACAVAMAAWTTNARAEDDDAHVAPVAEPPSAPPAEASKPPARPARTMAIGEAGDVVLEDVVGARSSNAISVPIAVNAPGTGGAVGGLGGVGFVSTGPSFSAAWFGMSSTDTEVNGATTTVTRWSFNPSADVFPARGVSIGGRLGIERTSIQFPMQTASIDSNAVSLDPRVGYIISVTPQAAVWPRVKGGVTLHHNSFTSSPPRQWRGGIDVPLVIRVSQHAVVDFGPELTYAVLDTNMGVVTRTLSIAGRGGLSLVF